MRGWHILRHSAQLVLRNIDAALRVSVVPFLATVATHIYLYTTPGLVPTVDEATGVPVGVADPGAVLVLLVLQFASVLGGLWIAVAWHRYVLTEELAPGWIPAFRGDLVLGYLGRSIMLGLLMMLAMVTLAIPGVMIMNALPFLSLVVIFSILCATIYLFLRLGVILPAGAVEDRLTLHRAWQATASEAASIVLIAVLGVFLFMLLQVPVLMLQGSADILAIAYGLALSWFTTMVGASVLTSLYGICVQGRGID